MTKTKCSRDAFRDQLHERSEQPDMIVLCYRPCMLENVKPNS